MIFKESLRHIHTVIMDIDGVLTDGKVWIMPDGTVVRNLHSRDGYALQLAVKKKLRLCIISGGNNGPVAEILRRTGIEYIFVNQFDKLQCYRDFIFIHELNEQGILYLGDDLPDLEVMKRCGLCACPNNAAEEIKEMAHYVSPFNGGEGFVRDVLEQVLRSQNKWETVNW